MGRGRRAALPPPPPPYLRPTVVRNHEQRPELARQAGRPGDMDQRDRAGEPKQLWSPNTETHSILSLLGCSLSLSRSPSLSLPLYLSLTPTSNSEPKSSTIPKQAKSSSHNKRERKWERTRRNVSFFACVRCWCVGVTVGSNSFIFSGRSLSCLTWWKRISGPAPLTVWLKRKTPHHLEGSKVEIDLWEFVKKCGGKKSFIFAGFLRGRGWSCEKRFLFTHAVPSQGYCHFVFLSIRLGIGCTLHLHMKVSL